MTSTDVFEQIEKMGDLPSLPRTLLRVQKIAADDRSCADDLAECILQDQALTMRVLKVVNSAMYQRRKREKVRTVRRAVIVIGFESVRKLALGLSVFDMMSKLSRSPWLAKITNHSLITAAFAHILAEASGTVAPEEAFVTALIHDVGKIVLLECSPTAWDAVLDDRALGLPALEAERRHFGLTHDRAGRRLAARWQLPLELQNAIGDHHDIDHLQPPKNLDPLLGVIVYANAMSRFRCTPEHQELEYRILRRAGRALGITSSRLETIYTQVEDEIISLADCLDCEVGDLADYAQVVNAPGSASVAPRGMNEAEVARRTADQLKLYQDVGRGLATGQDPDSLLDLVLQGAVDIVGFERVVLLAADRDDHLLKPLRWAGIEAQPLAQQLELPLSRHTGALALAVFEHRDIHVPSANSEAYQGMAGQEVLTAARCKGFVAVPVLTPTGVFGVIYADCGPDADDVVAEQAAELGGLAQQISLVLAARVLAPVLT